MTADSGHPACHVEMLSSGDDSVGFVDEWYDANAESHFWFDWRFRALIRQLRSAGPPLRQHLRALDIGCGTGIIRAQLERQTAWSVDVSDLNLGALGRVRGGRGRVLYYNVFDRRPDMLEAYDVAMLFDVIEHVEKPEAFLAATAGHLRPGGWLLVNVPALPGLFSVYDRAAGHLRRYGKSMLRAQVEPLGLSVIDIRYWGMSMVPLLWLRKLAFGGGRGRTDGEIIRRGFSPPGRLSHAILRAAMKLETAVCRRPPLGSSLLLVAQKMR